VKSIRSKLLDEGDDTKWRVPLILGMNFSSVGSHTLTGRIHELVLRHAQDALFVERGAMAWLVSDLASHPLGKRSHTLVASTQSSINEVMTLKRIFPDEQ